MKLRSSLSFLCLVVVFLPYPTYALAVKSFFLSQTQVSSSNSKKTSKQQQPLLESSPLSRAKTTVLIQKTWRDQQLKKQKESIQKEYQDLWNAIDREDVLQQHVLSVQNIFQNYDLIREELWEKLFSKRDSERLAKAFFPDVDDDTKRIKKWKKQIFKWSVTCSFLSNKIFKAGSQKTLALEILEGKDPCDCKEEADFIWENCGHNIFIEQSLDAKDYAYAGLWLQFVILYHPKEFPWLVHNANLDDFVRYLVDKNSSTSLRWVVAYKIHKDQQSCHRMDPKARTKTALENVCIEQFQDKDFLLNFLCYAKEYPDLAHGLLESWRFLGPSKDAMVSLQNAVKTRLESRETSKSLWFFLRTFSQYLALDLNDIGQDIVLTLVESRKDLDLMEKHFLKNKNSFPDFLVNWLCRGYATKEWCVDYFVEKKCWQHLEKLIDKNLVAKALLAPGNIRAYRTYLRKTADAHKSLPMKKLRTKIDQDLEWNEKKDYCSLFFLVADDIDGEWLKTNLLNKITPEQQLELAQLLMVHYDGTFGFVESLLEDVGRIDVYCDFVLALLDNHRSQRLFLKENDAEFFENHKDDCNAAVDGRLFDSIFQSFDHKGTSKSKFPGMKEKTDNIKKKAREGKEKSECFLKSLLEAEKNGFWSFKITPTDVDVIREVQVKASLGKEWAKDRIESLPQKERSFCGGSEEIPLLIFCSPVFQDVLRGEDKSSMPASYVQRRRSVSVGAHSVLIDETYVPKSSTSSPFSSPVTVRKRSAHRYDVSIDAQFDSEYHGALLEEFFKSYAQEMICLSDDEKDTCSHKPCITKAAKAFTRSFLKVVNNEKSFLALLQQIKKYTNDMNTKKDGKNINLFSDFSKKKRKSQENLEDMFHRSVSIHVEMLTLAWQEGREKKYQDLDLPAEKKDLADGIAKQFIEEKMLELYS